MYFGCLVGSFFLLGLSSQFFLSFNGKYEFLTHLCGLLPPMGSEMSDISVKDDGFFFPLLVSHLK